MTEQRIQRRLAAILAADVVGYSRLMAADETGTLQRLKALRQDVLDPQIAEHRGRLVKVMGDGALVEFASVVDAVGCAVAIQRDADQRGASIPESQRIALRIGINLGDVIVEGEDIYGDGVNIAARLQSLAEPGGIFVSGTVLEHLGNRAGIHFDDRGEQQLKNLNRPIHVYRVRPESSEAHIPRPPVVPSQTERSTSIAVLPFANMSGDPGQEYFSDGITEDIITELSRFRSLFVIARNSSFKFKNRATDIREIGKELGVRYVVEGSVRRAGNRVRVTAQLIEAASGSHLWADRYDRELADVFAVQDEVTRQVVVNIAPRLQIADEHSARRRTPNDMRAYDHYLQAKPLVDAPHDRADLVQAREHCNRAIEINPGYARAYAYKALSYIIGIPMIEQDEPEDWRKLALTSAERAVALDDLDNVCHWALGESAFWAEQPDRARRHIRRAIALNPNDADVLAAACYLETALGDSEVGMRHMAMALERNPTNPSWYHWAVGAALATIGRYAEALAEYDQYNPPNIDVMKLQAIALAQLGRLDEARERVRAMLAIRPDLTVGNIRKRDSCWPDADLRADSLRLAGMPE